MIGKIKLAFDPPFTNVIMTKMGQRLVEFPFFCLVKPFIRFHSKRDILKNTSSLGLAK